MCYVYRKAKSKDTANKSKLLNKTENKRVTGPFGKMEHPWPRLRSKIFTPQFWPILCILLAKMCKQLRPILQRFLHLGFPYLAKMDRWSLGILLLQRLISHICKHHLAILGVFLLEIGFLRFGVTH